MPCRQVRRESVGNVEMVVLFYSNSANKINIYFYYYLNNNAFYTAAQTFAKLLMTLQIAIIDTLTISVEILGTVDVRHQHSWFIPLYLSNSQAENNILNAFHY